MLAVFMSAIGMAGSLSGVEMPDTITSQGEALQLNGMGLRERLSFDIYVAGLYTPKKTKDPRRIIRSSVPKQIHCEIIFPRVPKARMVATMTDNLKNNPDVSEEIALQMQDMLMQLTDLKKGDKMSFEYHPKTGLILKINGQIKGEESDPEFIKGVFGMYLGDFPVSKQLKKGLLGQ